ncbi:Flavin-containing monooxygenase YUCCA10 [Morus notabilis]|uniref:Flavin-containing monooxygenase n=1 Tax=Morus notabilis TaxID=981085 RepID=W9RDQ4_9ROSA|nr:Flavin-containing monooxygenase YUCCA10 [Morus notabilis]
MEEVRVAIVGAGPSGLATSACLNIQSISNVVLEREDCCASLWKKRAYERLSLHLAKQFCSLPYKQHSSKTSTFMSKDTFISYVDSYVSELNITPRYSRCVVSALFDETKKKWRIEAKNEASGEMESYASDYLVVASGKNSEPFIPKVQGLESFKGEVIHSSDYKCGEPYRGKDVLVVGCGNSGMEISNDLTDYEARTTIVIRSPFHVLTKKMVHMGMLMTKYLPVGFVDTLISFAAKIKYGDLSKHGIHRPAEGPFVLKTLNGKTPIIDGGSINKIKSNKIKVTYIYIYIYVYIY